ncbi:MAG: hypothetical protein OXC30_03475 [Alphaproteobacteria bacterium]|nr:hypothetical protein [Alphaproteobacteria bacterium]
MQTEKLKFSPIRMIGLGTLNGSLYPLMMWGTQMWMKSRGYSNTSVGLMSLLLLPVLLKMPLAHYASRCSLKGFLGAKSHYMGFFSAAALTFSLFIFMMSWVTPTKPVFFLSFMFVGMVALSLTELSIEIIRLRLSLYFTSIAEIIISFANVGYRLGGFLVKSCLLGAVAFSSWEASYMIVALIFASTVFFLKPVDRVLSQRKAHIAEKGGIRVALSQLKSRYGWSVFAMPCFVVFGDTFARSMLGMMLIDQGFSLATIGWGYGIGYGSGMVGAMVCPWLFPGPCPFKRLAIVGSINAFSNMLFLLVPMMPSLTVMTLTMGFAGFTQGAFLQLERLCFGELTSEKYAVEQMALFFSLWALSNVLTAGGGALADYTSWTFFFVFSGLVYIFGLISIYFVRKRRQNEE